MNLSAVQIFLTDILLFAQGAEQGGGGVPGDAPADGGAGAANGQGGGSGLMQMAPMLIMFVVLFYFIVMRPQQKEQQRRQELLESIKKNDKVLTIGGIIGTVVDFSPDGNRVTLRVDDGTRIKFTRSSIQGPYDEKAEAEAAGEQK